MIAPPLRSRVFHLLTHAVASHRDNPVLRAAAYASRMYLDCYENRSYEIDRNGESRVLQILSLDSPARVFDVGANVGDWAIAARRAAPSAEIHCFEIVPVTAERLARRVGSLSGVIVNPYGLSDADSAIEIKHYPEASFVSGVGGVFWVTGDSSAGHETLQCQVRRGDAYCAERDITAIDLLKLDTEGMDYRVLRGFEGMLGAGAIAAVQFEYGRVNIATGSLLKDFFELLTPFGYRIGKVFPQSVEFRDYSPLEEDFHAANYLAVREDRSDLLARLAEDQRSKKSTSAHSRR